MYTLKDAFKLPLVGEVKQMIENKHATDGIIGSYRPFDVVNMYQRDKKSCEAMKIYTSMYVDDVKEKSVQ